MSAIRQLPNISAQTASAAGSAQREGRFDVSLRLYKDALGAATSVAEKLDVARAAYDSEAPQSRANERLVAKIVHLAVDQSLDLIPSGAEAMSLAYLARQAQERVSFDGTYLLRWSPLLAAQLGIDAMILEAARLA